MPNSASTSGYIITLYGDPISWRSHKQHDYVNTSTGCTEYIAMSKTGPELISLDKAIREMENRCYFPITMWCDNQAARDNTEMEGCHKMKMFDDDLNVIIENLEYRAKTGKRKHEFLPRWEKLMVTTSNT